MRKLFIFLLSVFLLSFVSAVVPVDDFLFYDVNSTTNYSIYINSTVWLDEWNVTDEGFIQFYNVSSNSSNTPIFHNTNATYNSRVDFYGVYTNLLCYTSNNQICNGTSLDINSNDFTQVNITILPNESIYFLNNYIATQGSTRPNDPINISGVTITNSVISFDLTSTITDEISTSFNPTTNVPSGYTPTRATNTPDGSTTIPTNYDWDSTTDDLSFESVNLTASNNEVDLSLTTDQEAEICNDFFGMGTSLFSFVAILIIVGVAGVLMFFLLGEGEFDLTSLGIAILIMSLIIIFGMIIINNINGC